MKIIEKHIAKTVVSAIVLVTLLLIGLQIFMLFVNELDDLGRANFGIVQVAIYVLLQVPYQVYLFFPMASLLGCLIGLGQLATNSELIVVRASGMSIAQIIIAVLKAVLVLILLVTILGETLVPKMAYYANERKALALSAGQALRTEQGVWLRQGNDFISIGDVRNKTELHNIFQYSFNEQHQLNVARHIDKANYHNGQWLAYGIAQTKFLNNKTQALKQQRMIWSVAINPAILHLADNEPDEMNLLELYRYINAQKKSHQNSVNFELAFWQRLLQPYTTCVMMFLAIPFIFGPLRSSSMGQRLLVGALFGFSFHILNRIVGTISQVYQVSPLVGAFVPSLLFTLIAFLLMRRVK